MLFTDRKFSLRSVGVSLQMDEQTALQTMERKGYLLLPKAHPASPGYGGLLVAIREEPAGLGYDPQSVRVWIADKIVDPSWETMSYNTPLQRAEQVVTGRLILSNRSKERIEFFSFGGKLESFSTPGATVYSISSQAPIMELFEPRETVPDQLVYETEGILAKVGARLSLDSKDFAHQLAKVDPVVLYAASVYSILLHYQQSNDLRESFPDLYHSLLKEREWLNNGKQWLTIPTTLDELLAPDDPNML